MSTQTAPEPHIRFELPIEDIMAVEEGALCLLCNERFLHDDVAFCPMCGEAIPGGPLFAQSRPGELLKTLRFSDPPMLGGTSQIYPTRVPETGALVAVKVSHREASQEGDFLFHEGVVLRQLSHPNIPRIYEQGCLANGTPYLIIDFIEGRSLEQMIHTHGPLLPSAVAATGAVLCDVLDHVHSRGMIHRDVKPDNIIMKGARPFLIDFATALFVDDTHKDSKTSGTAWYMPPEQVMADDLDYSADVYALGVSLYQMLTGGVLPFHDDDPGRVAILKVAQDPLSICAYFPDVPEALGDVIMTAIARDPDDRYPTMSAFKEALEGFMFGLA